MQGGEKKVREKEWGRTQEKRGGKILTRVGSFCEAPKARILSVRRSNSRVSVIRTLLRNLGCEPAVLYRLIRDRRYRIAREKNRFLNRLDKAPLQLNLE